MKRLFSLSILFILLSMSIAPASWSFDFGTDSDLATIGGDSDSGCDRDPSGGSDPGGTKGDGDDDDCNRGPHGGSDPGGTKGDGDDDDCNRGPHGGTDPGGTKGDGDEDRCNRGPHGGDDQGGTKGDDDNSGVSASIENDEGSGPCEGAAIEDTLPDPDFGVDEEDLTNGL